MPVTIQTKNGVGAPASLTAGELAVSPTTNELFVGDGTSVVPLVGPTAPPSSLPASVVTGTPDGVKIVLGSTGTDANTLYFV